MTAILWLRRDLRRDDLPALLAAAKAGPVLPLFVIDPALWHGSGRARQAWLAANVLATREAYEGLLCVRVGDPRVVLPQVAAEAGAASVHVSRETTPTGARRDRAVARALAAGGVGWVETGSPYAVGPGIIRSGSGEPYLVFTPFHRAWLEHGWPAPAESSQIGAFVDHRSDAQALSLLAAALDAKGVPPLPEPGETAALMRWRAFLAERLEAYPMDRDRPDRLGSAQVSADLKVGTLHPRTLLADLAAVGTSAAESFARQVAWREFYADVLHHQPRSAWQDLRPELAGLVYDEDAGAVQAWREGRTGFPIVDAGMRQLLATGWMHNRVRMITASFLTKDLHVWWPVGARHFMEHLIDADVASNSHGWQWVAGTGTDASPYFRVFNPITQGEKFDPDGAYVRRWVPEVAHLPGRTAHQPWNAPDGYAHGYPTRLVDHAAERQVALDRYAAARGRQPGP